MIKSKTYGIRKSKGKTLKFKDAKIVNFFVNTDIRYFAEVLHNISKGKQMTFKESFEYFCYILTV